MAKGETRRASRLAAVQALYELDLSGKGINETLAEFEAHWLGREVDEIVFQPADAPFFRAVVEGVVREQLVIDPRIDAALAKGWPLRRIEAVLRAILRCGAFELHFRKDVPAKVIITQYVQVTQSFYAEDEPGLVNAVLDGLGREVRVDELDRRPAR